MALNSIKLVNTGSIQQMQDVPVTVAAGACSTSCALVNNGNQYINYLLNASSFWRYNVLTDTWQQLANPKGAVSFVAGCSVVYDPNVGTMGGVWLFTPKTGSPYCILQVYDIALDTWTTKAIPSGLAVAWETAATLLVTPTQAHASGDNDAIYLAGNNATTWYKYSKSGDSWAEIATALPAAAGAACKLIWEYGKDPNKILYIRGALTSAMYEYDLTAGTFGSALAFQPSTETYGSGSSWAYNGVDRVFVTKEATRRIYSLNLAALRMRPFGTIPYSGGVAREGDKMTYVADSNSEWIYLTNNSASQFYRFEIIPAAGSD